ncbi:MAG: hypothetical protein MUF24_03865 [Chitinophagaceae bacterium]|jgi:hypothetical protein|nr:hypothetical protein [Chitinophagaceae bacterium]
MKIILKHLVVAGLASLLLNDVQAQAVPEWKVVTVIESIVPAGLGRSRMIENMTEINTEEFRASRTDGKRTNEPLPRRKELKVDKFDETKMLNFFSIGGINFQNIASNDAMIGARIMELYAEGWKMAFVTSAVESDAGGQDGQGIFITRMFFMRTAQPAAKE